MAHVHVRVHFRENFAHFRQTEIRENIGDDFFLKGVFSKPSGNSIVAPIFDFLSYSSFICSLRKVNIVLLFKKHKMVHFIICIDNDVILNT